MATVDDILTSLIGSVIQAEKKLSDNYIDVIKKTVSDEKILNVSKLTLTQPCEMGIEKVKFDVSFGVKKVEKIELGLDVGFKSIANIYADVQAERETTGMLHINLELVNKGMSDGVKQICDLIGK